MGNRLTPVLVGCIALLVILLAPSASGSSSAAEGSITTASFRSATLKEDLNYNVYLPGRIRRFRRAVSGALSPARPWRLDERLDADEEHAGRADRGGGDSADDRDHARRALEQPRELLRRLGVQGRGSRPAGGDGVHVRSDPARRRRVSDCCRPLGPRHRRLLDGRLRRDALLARASRSLRCRDRAQPGRVLPGAAARLQHARVRSLRQGTRSCSSRRSTSS